MATNAHGVTFRGAAAAAAALLLAGIASAASLRASDGTSFVVQDVPRLVLPFASASMGPSIGGGLRFDVTDAAGRQWSGVVPGTLAVNGRIDATMAQNPATGQVFLAYGSPDDPYQPEVSFSVWQGQGWSDPRPIGNRVGRAANLRMTFLPQGDVVMAWESWGAVPTLLFRHAELTASGEIALHAFLDIGPTRNLLHPVGEQVQLGQGLAWLAVEPGGDQADVFVSDPAQGSMGLVSVELTRAIDPGGFGAPPVPATLSGGAVEPLSTGGGPVTGAGAHGEPDGELVLPFRVTLMGADVYYWFEDTAVVGVAFHDGTATRLVEVARPPLDEMAHFAILRAVRVELAHELRLEAPAGTRPGERGGGPTRSR